MITFEIIAGSQTGLRLSIDAQDCVIGRNPDGDVFLDDPEASWAHCSVRLSDNQVLLTDLGSTNGTRVGGEPVQAPMILNSGDTFCVGVTEIRVWFVAAKPQQSQQTEHHWPTLWSGTQHDQTLALSVLQEKTEPLPKHLRSRPRLSFTSGPHTGAKFYLSDTTTTLGRSGDNEIVINDPLVALRQCSIVTKANEPAQLVLAVESPSLTVNGCKASTGQRLNHGDLIQVGGSIIEFGAAGVDPHGDLPMETMALPEGRFTLPGRVLIQPVLTIGRDPNCDIYLDGPRTHIASRHAEIQFVMGEFLLKTGGSLATYLNGQRAVEARLAHGDVITIGHFTIQIQLSGLTCDCAVSENSPGIAVEHFASNHDSFDPNKTMYRVAHVQDEKSPDGGSVEGPVQRHRPIWVPPLDTRKEWRTLGVVIAGIISAAVVLWFLDASDGRGFLDAPISRAHNSTAFNQASVTHLNAQASCQSCHVAFGEAPDRTCQKCHIRYDKGSHQTAQIGCIGCHLEHPTKPVSRGLVDQVKCENCHEVRHAELIAVADAPPGTQSVADLKSMRAHVAKDQLHSIHVGIKGQCAGCHADVERKAPIKPQFSCLRCHGDAQKLAVTACKTCHSEHQALGKNPTASPTTDPQRNDASGPFTPKSKDQAYLWAFLALIPLFAVVGFRRRHAVDHGMEAYQPVKKTELKKLIHIYEDACVGCAECVVACPFDVLALTQLKTKKVVARVVNFDSCRECGDCEAVCKPLALTRRYPGEPLPMVNRPDLDPYYMTNIPGLYLIGEAAGKALVRHASNLGARTIRHMVHDGVAPGQGQSLGLDYDVLIVGSGPGGLSAGLEANAQGLHYQVLEKGTDFAQTIRSYPKGKPVQNQPSTTKAIGALPLADTQREKLLDMWSKKLADSPIAIRYRTEVKQVQPLGHEGMGFRVVTDQGELTALRVVLATGTRGSPRKLTGVPGHEHEKIRYQLVDPDEHQGDNIAVIGGGNSALEAAIALAGNQDSNNEVTLIYRKDSFARASQKNIDSLQALVDQGRIRLHLNSHPIEIADRELTVQNTAGESQTLPNEFIYCMLGAEPPSQWLKSMGISFSEKPQGWSPGPSDDVSFVNP